jgi:hypothetical protein
MLKSILAHRGLQRFSRGLDESNASLQREAFADKRPPVRGIYPELLHCLFILSLGVGLYSEDAATAVKKS